MGYARLNYRVDSVVRESAYIRAEVGSGLINQPHTIIFNHQRWNITYIDPKKYDIKVSKEEYWDFRFKVGFTTNWNIAYY